MIKFDGLELAVKQFNGYQGEAVVFVDFEDNTAWCNVLDIPSYHSNTIVPVIGKDDLYSRNDKYRAEAVAQLAVKAKALLDEGREAWELECLLADEYAEALR